MKRLLLYAHDYWLRPYEKSVPEAADRTGEITSRAAVVALVHVEPADPGNHARLVTKAIKQVKWLAGKFGTRAVVLHSFAHLASARAEPAAAEALLADMQQRLAGAGYEVLTSPFGYFNEVPGARRRPVARQGVFSASSESPRNKPASSGGCRRSAIGARPPPA